MLAVFDGINNGMDFGLVLIVLSLGALVLIVAGGYGASCKACKPKAPRRPRNGESASETLKSR